MLHGKGAEAHQRHRLTALEGSSNAISGGVKRAVFGKCYDAASVGADILDELGDEASSVVRFNMHGVSARGHEYDVEYVLFTKTRDGKIYEVVELLDTHASNEQHRGNRIGVPPAA